MIHEKCRFHVEFHNCPVMLVFSSLSMVVIYLWRMFTIEFESILKLKADSHKGMIGSVSGWRKPLLWLSELSQLLIMSEYHSAKQGNA